MKKLTSRKRVYNGYENLIGIDSAFILICLTGGVSLRFNPSNLHEKSSILDYMSFFKEKSSLIGILGFEINKVIFNFKYDN
jgi:hypothetical protein